MRQIITLHLLLIICSTCFSQKAFPDYLLDQPQKNSKEFEAKFIYKEAPHYLKNNKEKSVIIKNGYASSILQPPIIWPLKLKPYFVKEIKVIFTKYPADKNFWNTNYYDLLAARLKAAFVIDPSLNDSRINYLLVLQTACESEEQAKTMLHGIEIVYEIGVRENDDEEEKEDPNNKVEPIDMDLDSILRARDMEKADRFFKKSKSKDTVVLNSLNELGLKDSLLIVIDCTGSMAPYYSQVSLWASKNFKPDHYYVMFNDGGSRLLPLGKTGGYEDGRVKSVAELIKLLRKASGGRGNNKESPENTIEGLLVGLKAFPDNRGVILIADNSVCIRDYKLLYKVDKPVHVIPCGGTLLNPLLLNLACYTKGSVMWGNTRIDNWNELCKGEFFKVGSYHYRYNKRKHHFEAYDSNVNRINFCDGYTFNPKKNQKE